MRWEACRPGQREAIKTIIDQYLAGAHYTPIILPTRYGKSDVMRAATVLLWADGLLPCALVLSPNAVLRDQINADDRWQQCIARYGLKWRGFKKRTLEALVPNFTSNGEVFVSTTTQLVDRNADIFADWVDSITHRTGRRPIVFIDECHTGSEDNSWGETAMQLAGAGAHVVLLTATAMRSDGRRIPGFDFELVAEEPVTVTITRPGSQPELIRVEMYQGEKRLLKLIARPPTGHETTFKEAWGENPSPLCLVGRVPFDVDVSMTLGRDEQARLLSTISSEAEARRILGRVVRTRPVIREGVQRLVTELRRFRATRREIAGIIFCGNDQEGEEERSVNRHANDIRNEIEQAAPEFTVVIATSAEAGKERIQSFSKGAGDILIVKQMASLGLDIPRMKVGLDLSPVRTPAAYIQRLMRIATPHEGIRHCIYIAPDDVIGRALFAGLVSDSNGAATATDLELIRAYEKPRREDSPETPIYTVNGTDLSAFEDSSLNRAEAEQWPVAQAFLEAFPPLITLYSHAQIAAQASKFRLLPKAIEPPVHIEDTGREIADLRADINEIARNIASGRMGNAGYNREEYAEIIRDVFVRAYALAGVPVGTRLDQINDLAMLQRIRSELHGMASQSGTAVFEFTGDGDGQPG